MINKLSKWLDRKLNPVQVGDIWAQKDVNPFNERLRFRVIEIKDGWAKLEGVVGKTIGTMKISSVQFWMDFVEENNG